MIKNENVGKISRAIYIITGILLILFVGGYFAVDRIVQNYYKNCPFTQVVDELNKTNAENCSGKNDSGAQK